MPHTRVPNDDNELSAGSKLRTTATSESELGVIDILIVFAKYKWLLLGLPFLVSLAAAFVSMQLPNTFTATAKVLPPQHNQSAASAMLGQLGALAGGAAAGLLGAKNPADIYVGLLKSRTLADALIERFNLKDEYKAKLRSDVRLALIGATKINAGKDGFITIEVEDRSPKRAAELANGYVEELDRLTGVLAVTEAAQRRLFYERQLKQAKDNLLKAELALRGALESGGLAMVDAQGRSMVETSAQLRARIAAKEVEIHAMHSFATEQNPDYLRARQELGALRQQISKIEGGNDVGRTAAPTLGKEQGIKNLGLLREVKYHELLFELLAKQYESAKIDEARESAVIQLVDPAIEPDRRSGPKRTLIVVLSALVAAIIALLAAFFLEALDRARSDSGTSNRLAELRRYLTGQRT